MRTAISGASGLIGSALASTLESQGWEVLRLVRREPRSAGEVRWDPSGQADPPALEGVDAVVHLAGAGIGGRPWTKAYKKEIYDSRIQGTTTLARSLAALGAPPRVFVSGSAVGFYGDTGAQEITEDAPAGQGFLADLVADWEAAAEPAAKAGIRVVHPRSGIVLDRQGGLLAKMLPAFRFGLGAQLGNGRQWTSWITLRDEVAALQHLITSDLTGPVNLTAPHPVTNAEFTKAIGRALHRPTPLFVPASALRLILRDFASEGPLISQRVLPHRLKTSGFTFQDPALDVALRTLLRT